MRPQSRRRLSEINAFDAIKIEFPSGLVIARRGTGKPARKGVENAGFALGDIGKNCPFGKGVFSLGQERPAAPAANHPVFVKNRVLVRE